MTIIVSVKINDGIVMAADSALTFQSGQIYHNANKIVNLRKGLPIGVMSTGYGGIGNESMETLFKDLRKRFTGGDAAHREWKIDPANYTIGDVANRVREFLFVEKAQSGGIAINSYITICGYSADRPLGETWNVILNGTTCDPPRQLQAEQGFGPLWSGEMEALDRLIFGFSSESVKAAAILGLTEQQVDEALDKIRPHTYNVLSMNAMPMQDAIDLARYLVETTIGFMKFSIGRGKTVGGFVEIAAITKHEGFKWVQRKHFYKVEFNAPFEG
jgi:hypothetical protein